MAKLEIVGSTNIWWFPKSFSQSRYGEYKNSGTNSCTIISLLLADRILKNCRSFNRPSKFLSRQAYKLFCESINTGNRLYNKEITLKLPPKTKRNLNIPDAINIIQTEPSLKFQLKEWYYVQICVDPNDSTYSEQVVRRLAKITRLTLKLFEKLCRDDKNDKRPAKYLFAALIADRRTNIMTFEMRDGIVALFDSHRHGSKAGAVYAQVPLKDLNEILMWFVTMINVVYKSKPKIYEISFLTSEQNISKSQLPLF